MRDTRVREYAKEAAEAILDCSLNADEIEDYLFSTIGNALTEQRGLCVECDEPSGANQIRCTECHEAMEHDLKMPTTMAEEIVGACIKAGTYETLVASNPDLEVPDLKRWSLDRLLEANHRLQELRKGMGLDGKLKHVLRMTCDDRLVAALYTAYTYEPESTDEPPRPIVLLPDRALILVQRRRHKWFRDPDPERDCDQFVEGEPDPDCVQTCQGDGHYMCEECTKLDRGT